MSPRSAAYLAQAGESRARAYMLCQQSMREARTCLGRAAQVHPRHRALRTDLMLDALWWLAFAQECRAIARRRLERERFEARALAEVT